MEKIKINLLDFSEEDVDKVVVALKEERVVVLPTDTIYGLSCSAISEKAIKKVFKIKNRDESKPFIVLMKSFCMLREYCFLSQRQYRHIKETIEKNIPTTFILKMRKSELSKTLVKDETVAVRIPVGNAFLMNILKKVNLPLISTSLNVEGRNPLTTVEKINSYFKIKPDLVVDAGDIPDKKASVIMDIRDINNIRKIRG